MSVAPVAIVAAAVVIAAACSDGPGRLTAPGCHGERVLTADVDGDGRLDRAYFESRTGGRLGVCTAAGIADEIAVGGEAEGEFHAIDVEGDGAVELVHGGTTLSQSVVELTVFEDGGLQPVVDERGERILLVEGARHDDAGVAADEAWGCGSARGVLVQSSIRRTADGRGERVLTTYRLRGTTVETSVRREPAPRPSIGLAALHVVPCRRAS